MSFIVFSKFRRKDTSKSEFEVFKKETDRLEVLWDYLDVFFGKTHQRIILSDPSESKLDFSEKGKSYVDSEDDKLDLMALVRHC